MPDRKNKSELSKRRSGIRISFIEGSWAQIFITLTGGKFLTDLLLHLGAGPRELGFGAAVQPFASMLQLAGAYLSNWAGSRKKVIIPAAIVCRQSWWLVLPLLFLPIPQQTKLAIFFAIFFISMVADAIIANLWLSWTADLVPDAVRGRTMGKRNALMLSIALVADYAMSSLRDHAGDSYHTQYLAVVFGVAAAAGLVTVFLFPKQWEPPHRRDPPPPLGELINDVFAHTGTRRLMIARSVWNVAIGVAVPFWTPFMMNNLELPFTTILIYNVIVQGLTVWLGARLWGPVIDRAGTVPVMLINGLVIGFMPFLYLFTTKNELTCYWIDALTSGICWSGFNAAFFNVQLQAMPVRRRDFHLAIFTGVAGLVLAAASVAGGLLAEAMEGLHVTIAGREYGNLHAMFVLSGILRLSSLIVLRRVPDVRGRGIRFALATIGTGMKEVVPHPRILAIWRADRR